MSSSASAPSSLRQQLLFWLLAPLLALLVVNSVLGYRAAIQTANEAYDRLLLASVKAIADRVTISQGEITVDIPYVALELFESNIKERIFYKVSLFKQIYDPSVHGAVLIQVGETAESRQALSRRILLDGMVRQGLLILV